MASVQLLGVSPCLYVNRVQIALHLKFIEYEFIQENPHDRSERLLKANPVQKRIPVLIHDGKAVCESLIIVEYINDAWNNSSSILPSNPHDRALARFWAAYIDDKELREASTAEARKEIIGRIYEGSVLLEETFVKYDGGKPFFGGDNVGYLDIALGSLDIALGSLMGWVKATEVISGVKFLDELKTPGLAGWAEKICSHNAFKEVLPETQMLVEIYKMLQGRGKPASG
ncbi:unnamed protein product [Fraxinus pennsylvanica]|uniref:Glutathione S-transferase n=1 Tax=Fraxinus pennsylvanica TaxID=56036 RepID=A0AAD2A5I5_9LAMI|nr:unnamed protein product [Fraxinus pennsylvanica]